MEWFVASEDELEGVRYHEVGPFRLQIRQRGDEWDWSVHHSRDDASVASGIAPTMEVAESVIEEITGEKTVWRSRRA
jgi:hypothetical protein